MPTPDEIIAAPPTPPIESSSSRASFTSCPPEEERETHAPREARADGAHVLREAPASSRAHIEDVRARIQEPTPEPEARPGASREDNGEDGGLVADGIAETVSDSPSPSATPEADGRLAQSMATAVIASEEASYLDCSPLRVNRQRPHPQSTSSFLRPGSKFRGTQQSDRQVYDVQVEIKDVDLAESTLCGYLRIQGLTDDHPTLTTFFEGEIIGPKYLFRTGHLSWNSSEKIDLQHWARFPPWRPLAKSAKNSSTFTLKNYLDREHLFMRWKEYFLVPDHRVKSISGASFEGFYYICFDQRVGSVSGIYFHAKSEKYQQLELQHVHDGGCAAAVEFR